MSDLSKKVQYIFSTILALIPTIHQQETFPTILGSFLEATGIACASNTKLKSASATSRFLNRYNWATRKLITVLRKWVLAQILSYKKKGKKPHLEVILDLTTLEKRGKFEELNGLVRTYNRKHGLHLVILYLVIGRFRIPWNFRVYRGKKERSQADLGRRLLRSLPPILKKAFKLMVLADSAYSSIAFLQTVRKLKIHAVVGIRNNRSLVDGRKIRDLYKGGQQIYLTDLSFPVSVAHYYFKQDNGKRVKRYVISTKQLKPSTLVWWGKRRWKIEGFFKTIKHRFSLARFGQTTRKGVYRWILLGLIAFILTVCSYWLTTTATELDWRIAARSTLEILFPSVLLNILLVEIEKLKPIANQQGIDIQLQRC